MIWENEVNAHLNKNLSYRAIWISDVHLGTPGAQVTPLLEFLKHTECKTLYLVGDIIDGWQLKKRFFGLKAQRCNSKKFSVKLVMEQKSFIYPEIMMRPLGIILGIILVKWKS